MNQLIREIEIHKILGGDLDNNTIQLLNIFNSFFDKVVFKKYDNRHHNYLYMCIDDTVYLVLDWDQGNLYCSYVRFWLPFEQSGYSYNETEDIIRYLIVEHLRRRFSKNIDYTKKCYIELLIKINETIPVGGQMVSSKVEKQLKDNDDLNV